MVMEKPGRIDFLLKKGEPVERIAESLQQRLQYEIDSGTWEQHWPGDLPGAAQESGPDRG